MPASSAGRMSQKSDVYSFGVVLLELLTGRPPVDPSRPLSCQMLADQLLSVLQDTDVAKLQCELDAAMPTASVPVPQLVAFSEVANACLQVNPKQRPRMSKVVSFLEAIAAYRDSLPVNSSDGRSTLLSLMDAMSEVPPLDASQPLLLPVPALGPKEEALAGRPGRSAVGDRMDSDNGAECRVPSGRMSHPTSPSQVLTERSSFGPGLWGSLMCLFLFSRTPFIAESWPSMPLVPDFVHQHPALNAEPPRSLAVDDGVTQTATDRQAGTSGNPFSTSVASTRSNNPDMPQASASTQVGPLASGLLEARGWVAFDQPSVSPLGLLFGSTAADPAHFWPTAAQAEPDIVLSPRRPPPPPPTGRQGVV